MTYKKIGVLISIVALIIIGAGFLLFWRSHPSGPSVSRTTTIPSVKSGFTFFHLHRDTQLSEKLRDDLRGKLGSEAIETKTIIDFIVPARANDIFTRHFPELIALHQSLNYLPEERVEHDTTQLIYRYARKKGLPFDNVRLLFDNSTRRPLFFSIRSKDPGGELVNTLETKYGPSQKIDWPLGGGKTFYWKQDKDLLLATFTQSRIGAPEHYLGFYFTHNIEALSDRELQTRQSKKETGTAF